MMRTCLRLRGGNMSGMLRVEGYRYEDIRLKSRSYFPWERLGRHKSYDGLLAAAKTVGH